MKISVVITAHNDVATLANAINAVLSQSRKADEVIVVDDGSTDATSEVAKIYDEVSLLRQKHMGTFSARNNGVMMAEHAWIAFLDAKHEWNQDQLQRQLAFHKDNPQLKVSVYDGQKCLFLEEALQQGRINNSSIMMEKKLYETLGGFDEAFEISEDDEFWMRVLEAL
jgi:glycosyltransferase involved in cell wall biosynthesis